MLAAALAVFRGIEAVFELLWPKGPKVLFDTVPLKYIFDAGDAVMIVVFLYLGTSEAIRAYRARE